MLLLWLPALARECDPSLLDSRLDATEQAYLADDALGLSTAVDVAEKAMCDDAAPEQHARMHRARGLEDLLRQRPEDAREHLRAANAAFPLLLPTGPLATDPALSEGWAQAQERPTTWRLASTRPLQGLSTPLRPDTRVNRASSGKGRLIAGLVFAGLGAGLYGAAFVARDEYDGAVSERDGPRIKRAKFNTNALTTAGLGAMGVGGILVTWEIVR